MSLALDLTGLVLPQAVEEQAGPDDGHRAQFLLQPLERGYGHTIGNSIRRILLSSLPGTAVWAFRADGVQHEHQTIEGAAEDIHQIIQNLKRLVLILDPDIEEAKLELSIYKAGPVKAGQIDKHAGVTVVNTDHVLFTLQEDLPENRPLNLEFWINKGRGFVMADQHELPDDYPVGTIRIDSIYNPVVRANFVVSETRVGQRTDFDRLAIDVQTNGALEPSNAIRHAAEIARTHLGYLTNIGEMPHELALTDDRSGDASAPGGMQAIGDELLSVLELPLEAFEQISARSRNTLEKENIRLVADVAGMTRDEMLQVPNFGEKSLEEVAEVLAMHGLRFGMTLERADDGRMYVADEAASDDASSEQGSEE